MEAADQQLVCLGHSTGRCSIRLDILAVVHRSIRLRSGMGCWHRRCSIHLPTLAFIYKMAGNSLTLRHSIRLHHVVGNNHGVGHHHGADNLDADRNNLELGHHGNMNRFREVDGCSPRHSDLLADVPT